VVLLGFLALIAGTQTRPSGPISIGQKVPSFQMTTFDGQQYATADHTDKVIVVNFWASWCKPCEQEAQDMQTAWEYYKPGVRCFSWASTTWILSRRPWNSSTVSDHLSQRPGLTHHGISDVPHPGGAGNLCDQYQRRTGLREEGAIPSLNEIQGVVEQALASD